MHTYTPHTPHTHTHKTHTPPKHPNTHKHTPHTHTHHTHTPHTHTHHTHTTHTHTTHAHAHYTRTRTLHTHMCIIRNVLLFLLCPTSCYVPRSHKALLFESLSHLWWPTVLQHGENVSPWCAYFIFKVTSILWCSSKLTTSVILHGQSLSVYKPNMLNWSRIFAMVTIAANPA